MRATAICLAVILSGCSAPKDTIDNSLTNAKTVRLPYSKRHKRSIAYVANHNSHNVSVIDTRSNEVLNTFSAGTYPSEIAITPDGARGYVSNYVDNRLSVFDAASQLVVATIPIGPGQPANLAMTPDGKRLFVSQPLIGTIPGQVTFGNTVSVVDTTLNAVVAEVTVGGLEPRGIAVTPDGQEVFVADTFDNTVSVFDASSYEVLDTIAVGDTPEYLAINSDGDRVYVSNVNDNTISVIDTESDDVIDTIAGVDSPLGITVSPDGTRAYVADFNANTLSIIDTTCDRVIERVPVGTEPQDVALTEDGKHLYVSNTASDNVSVVDVSTKPSNVVTSVGVGDVPQGIAIAKTPAGHYEQHNLCSNRPTVPADHFDDLLVNPWGLAFTSVAPAGWYTANNGSGSSSYLRSDGTPGHMDFPVPGQTPGQHGSPTGAAANPTRQFVVTDGYHPGPASILYASEDGTISGLGTPLPFTEVFLAVDNSATGAVYKGLALAFSNCGEPRLYATDFHNNKIDVFDGDFAPVDLPRAFTDPDLPAGYAPFGIHNIDNHLFVTYAMQDADAHDDVPGEGHGFVDEYDAEGRLLRRVASGGALNSPWGVALAPAHFGPIRHDLLIANFGDGVINVYAPKQHHHHHRFKFVAALAGADGTPLAIDGLWSIEFGQGGLSGPTNTLFFTAGPNGEQDGLFGSIRFVDPSSH